MDSNDKEKQNLIEHLKNQQNILLCASQLSKQIEISEVFEIVKNILVKTVGVDSFSLHMSDAEDNLVLSYSYGLTDDKKDSVLKSDFFLKALSRSGITIYTKGSNFEELGQSFGIEGEKDIFSPDVAITLRDSKHVIGILCIYSFKDKKKLSDSDIQFFSMLSSQIGPALESAKLHKVKMSNLKAELLEEEAKNLKVVNDKLEESNTDLEKANKKLNDFVAIVAHDLRNPIGAIQSYSMLLKKSIDSKKLNIGERDQRMIHRITDLCELSIGLIRDILELGALGSGKLVITKDEFSIAEILDEAYENVLFFAQKKSVNLLKTTQSNKIVHVDKERIIQVITNLLTNSVKFTPSEGQVELNLSENEQESSVTIEVKDNGTGIPDAIIGKLFDKEAVTSTSGTDGEKGTGFGLPLCQDLVKEHDSVIKVESKIDEGSRFYFKLNY